MRKFVIFLLFFFTGFACVAVQNGDLNNHNDADLKIF